MKIQLLGHCSVLLSSENTQILLDPYFGRRGNLIYKRINPTSNYHKDIKELDGILLSHDHWDHMDFSFLSRFKNRCVLYAPKLSIKPLLFNRIPVQKGEEFRINDFNIIVVQANHVCPSVGYIIESKDCILYFSGDTYYGNFIKDISKKYIIDVAMLPVTSFFPPMTMGESGALHSLKDLMPKTFIPMHQDIQPRVPFTYRKVFISGLSNKILSKNLPTQFVHLKNGEYLDTDTNQIGF